MFEATSILEGWTRPFAQEAERRDIPKGTEGQVLIYGHLVSLGVPLMPCGEDGATSLRVTVVNPDVYSGIVRTVSALTTWAIRRLEDPMKAEPGVSRHGQLLSAVGGPLY